MISKFDEAVKEIQTEVMNKEQFHVSVILDASDRIASVLDEKEVKTTVERLLRKVFENEYHIHVRDVKVEEVN